MGGGGKPLGGQTLDQRERILEAAVRVMAGAGFDGAGLRAVAAEAGMAVGSIYVHFPGGKRQILFEMLERLAQAVRREDLRPGEPGREAAARVLTGAGYVAIGLGVLGVQQAQVRRREVGATISRAISGSQQAQAK